MSISLKVKTNNNILPILTTSQINNKSFDDAPDIYYQSLSLGGQRVFRGLVKYAVQWERMFFSQSWLASKCGLSLSQLKRLLKTFREDGVLSWIRRCNNTCIYTISSLFHSQRFHNALKRFIPAVVFFFAPSMLQSKPAPRQPQIKNELHSNIKIKKQGEYNLEKRNIRGYEENTYRKNISPTDIYFFSIYISKKRVKQGEYNPENVNIRSYEEKKGTLMMREEFSAMKKCASAYQERAHKKKIIQRHNGPELQLYNPPEIEIETEPIYVLYFKLKEHLETLPFTLSNPYRGRFEAHIKNALENVDTTPENLEAELYKIYLRLKKDGH